MLAIPGIAIEQCQLQWDDKPQTSAERILRKITPDDQNNSSNDQEGDYKISPQEMPNDHIFSSEEQDDDQITLQRCHTMTRNHLMEKKTLTSSRHKYQMMTKSCLQMKKALSFIH